ncbi:hypothetical protein ODJ79_18645 [Actinoplanes sp. KI2]|uniref:hypothetical protein n=1 Tax=Actinoplanes sp. KI2 TaxID=2983315 RepID=UPI0021D59638|nr:hypothetical protein [Actinoplanes sp. KI2]MCU7725753.1 hypothetical protein [Actinoplanes sp. KI2]
MRRAWPVLAVPAFVLAGCTNVDTSPIDSGIPNASSSASQRPLPSPGGHWKGFASQCPKLTSAAAKDLGVAGPGAPTDEYSTSAVVTQADCHWGSSDGHGNAVDARVSIWASQEAADAQWQTLSTGQSTPLDVGDQGFIAEEPDAVVVRTISGNAVATVRLKPPTGKPDTTPLHQAASEITNDVLDDLVAR